MNIKLNKIEIENLKKLLSENNIDNLEINQDFNSGIGINTYIITENKEIDITDYNSW